MKKLFILVSIAAVFTVYCLVPVDGHEDGDTGDSSENIMDGQQPEEIDTFVADSKSEARKHSAMYGQKYRESTKEDTEMEKNGGQLRRTSCKARNACVVMGGFCVTNITLCNGRLVPEGCKGINCQCCVPGTLESMIQELETELTFIKGNLTNENSDMKIELQTIKDNLTIHDSDIKIELGSLKDNITDAITNQNLQLEIIREHIGCPIGFFTPKNSVQCFKIFKDVTRTWDQSKKKCQDEGLLFAKPAAEITVYLREELLRIYGDLSYSWVDARGDGSNMVWQRNSTPFNDNSLLHNTLSGSTSRCLLLLVGTGDRNNKPSGPYDDHSCTSTSYYALCETK